MEASRSGMQDALGRSGAGGAGLVLRRRAGEQLSRPRWAAEAREGLPLGAGSPPPACLNFLAGRRRAAGLASRMMARFFLTIHCTACSPPSDSSASPYSRKLKYFE